MLLHPTVGVTSVDPAVHWPASISHIRLRLLDTPHNYRLTTRKCQGLELGIHITAGKLLVKASPIIFARCLQSIDIVDISAGNTSIDIGNNICKYR